ncbi:hypothetical protein GGF37_000747 [Kickxella alabastrina]|nr:hypothetical protein GGF37_000747 [Kickxella alabastrina]
MAAKIDDAMLAGALEYWKGVNLGTMLRELETAGLAIIDNQKLSLQERRKLAEKTKEFRAVPDDLKATEFKPLLRAYQNEIDALTKRMKYAENSFLGVFQSLGDAPDPAPLISGLVEERRQGGKQSEAQAEAQRATAKAQALAEENARLRSLGSENEALQKQVRALESSIEERVKEQAAQREREIREHNEDLVRHLKDREGDLQRQLSAANRTLVQLQSTYDSEEAERHSSASADRELIAKLAELDIMQSDLDHANARLADMQVQNAKLRSEMATLTGTDAAGISSSGGCGVAETLADYRRRVRELEDETKRLFDKLERAEAELSHQESKLESAVGAAERESAAKDDELRRLRAELSRRADYDEIHRDLDIMKSVEFSVSDWGLDDTSAAAAAAGAEEESLEKLLVRRNKSLENKLTDSRNRLDRCQADVRELNERCRGLERSLAEKTALAERLEADLLAVQPLADIQGDNASASKSFDAFSEATEAQAQAQTEPAAAGNSGLLDIITGQRDRFRQRNVELEDELREQGTSVADMRRQVDQMKQDNLRLYEEIKYLRSYTSTMASSSTLTPTTMMHLDARTPMPSKFSASGPPSANNPRVQIDMDTGVAAKYKGMYEESLNPFNVFHRRETSRRVRSMGVLDRLVYLFSHFVMGNRRARLVLVVYVAVLHLLVFVTLYRSMLIADESSHERVLPLPPVGN